MNEFLRLLMLIVFCFLVSFGVFLISGNALNGFKWLVTRNRRTVSAESLCPACGNSGCRVTFIAGMIEAPNGPGKVERMLQFKDGKSRLRRTCNTCGAICYEDVVRPESEWVGKL